MEDHHMGRMTDREVRSTTHGSEIVARLTLDKYSSIEYGWMRDKKEETKLEKILFYLWCKIRLRSHVYPRRILPHIVPRVKKLTANQPG